MASPLAVGSAVGSSGAVFQRPKESVVRRKRICTNRSRRVVRATAANGTVAPVTLNDDVNFYQVRAVIRPWRLDNVVRSLNIIGIGGKGGVRKRKGAPVDGLVAFLVLHSPHEPTFSLLSWAFPCHQGESRNSKTAHA
jgi:hypothetical protein